MRDTEIAMSKPATPSQVTSPKPVRIRFAALRGHAGKGMSTDQVMALTRG